MISSSVISAEICDFITECNGILQEFMIVSRLSISTFLLDRRSIYLATSIKNVKHISSLSYILSVFVMLNYYLKIFYLF